MKMVAKHVRTKEGALRHAHPRQCPPLGRVTQGDPRDRPVHVLPHHHQRSRGVRRPPGSAAVQVYLSVLGDERGRTNSHCWFEIKSQDIAILDRSKAEKKNSEHQDEGQSNPFDPSPEDENWDDNGILSINLLHSLHILP